MPLCYKTGHWKLGEDTKNLSWAYCKAGEDKAAKYDKEASRARWKTSHYQQQCDPGCCRWHQYGTRQQWMTRATARAERFQSHRNWFKLCMKASYSLSPFKVSPPSPGLSLDPSRDLGVISFIWKRGQLIKFAWWYKLLKWPS